MEKAAPEDRGDERRKERYRADEGSARRDRSRDRHKDRPRDKESHRQEQSSRRGGRDEDSRRHEHGSRRREMDDERRRHRSLRQRSRSRSESPSSRRHDKRHHRARSRDQTASPSPSSSSSPSGSEGEARERDRRERRRRRHRESGRQDSDDERRKRRRRRRHRETSEERGERKKRRADKEAKRKGRGSAVQDYGKHGIISEIDVASRLSSEFRQWLIQERSINPETISRAVERKEMSTFIEDYNTATMPSNKYYNLEAHERRMAMIRAGETVEEEGGYDPLADEAAAKASFKAKRRMEESSRETPSQWQSKEQLEAVSRRSNVVGKEQRIELENTTQLRRVQMERIEAAKMKQLGLQTSANLGVRMDGTEFDRR